MTPEELSRDVPAADAERPSGGVQVKLSEPQLSWASEVLASLAQAYPQWYPQHDAGGMSAGKSGAEPWALEIEIEFGKFEGTYYPDDRLIALRPDLSQGDFQWTLAHELGHHLSSGGGTLHLEGSGKKSVTHLLSQDVMSQEWYRATLASKQVISLFEAARRAHDHREWIEDPISESAFRAFASYLLDPEELLARCFAQHLAQIAPWESAQAQLDQYLRSRKGPGMLHWHSEDFQLIHITLGSLLGRRGGR